MRGGVVGGRGCLGGKGEFIGCEYCVDWKKEEKWRPVELFSNVAPPIDEVVFRQRLSGESSEHSIIIVDGPLLHVVAWKGAHVVTM